MKVYVVMGGWAYEGSDDESVKLFTDKDKAEAYAADLVNKDSESYWGYDNFSIVERDIE